MADTPVYLLPIYNPPVPFLGSIPGGIKVGMKLTIKGIMTQTPKRLTIDLQDKRDKEQTSVALHLSIRPLEFMIVRNHYQNSKWGAEERIGGCPIQPRQAYTIEIIISQGLYSIFINGDHFCEFYHRLPMESLSFIRIGGATMLRYIGKETNVTRPISLMAPVSSTSKDRSSKYFQEKPGRKG